MKNFTSGTMTNDDRRYRLDIKIFNGLPEKVEKQIRDFIDNNPLEIQQILQSESGTGDYYSVTITIFYYSEGKPQFIDERYTVEIMADKIVKEIEYQYGEDVNDILDKIYKRRKKL